MKTNLYICSFTIRYLFCNSYFRFLLSLALVDIVAGVNLQQCDVEAEFECEPGVCIPRNLTCNGIFDCELGQDEEVAFCGEKIKLTTFSLVYMFYLIHAALPPPLRNATSLNSIHLLT